MEGLDDEGLHRRRECLREYWKLSKRHESLLQQKSRIKWFKEGDENTNFLHNSIGWRRRKQAIKGLDVGGCWVKDPNTIKEGAMESFKKRY